MNLATNQRRGCRAHVFLVALAGLLLFGGASSALGQEDRLGTFLGRLFERPGPTPTAAPPSQPVYPVVTLSGSVGERPARYDFIAPDSMTVREVLDTIETARTDPYVEGLFVYIDQPDLGWARVAQLRRAIEDFQSTGRRAYAYLQSEDTLGYLVASACKEITMPEPSVLYLTGVRADLYFVRNLLDKVGARADVVAVGQYKDAMEMFTETEMSESTREMLTSLVDDLTSQAVAMVSRSRDLPPEKARELFTSGPYTAAQARENGLIDTVEYYDQRVWKLEEVAGHSIDVQYDYGFEEPEGMEVSFFTFLQQMMQGGHPYAGTGKPFIALVYATGEIVPGYAEDYPFAEDLIAQEDFLGVIDDLESDENAHAVVLRIDSPGGSAEAADVIWNRLKLLSDTLPVVVSMGDLAASGGYYIATPADRIFAERGTLTGSIGVIGAKLVLGDLYQKIGIQTQSVGGGPYSDLFSETRSWNEDEREKMRFLLDDTYQRFVGKVAGDRGMTLEAVDAVAQGRVWTGRQAAERGLVDEIGGIEDAIAEAREMAGFKPEDDVEVVVFPEPLGLLDYLGRVMGMTGVHAATRNGRVSAGSRIPPRPHRHSAPVTGPGTGPHSVSSAVVMQGAADLLPLPLRHAAALSLLIRNSRFLARAPYDLQIH